MREMKDASTDIIVVSNELLCKEEMAIDFDKHFSRGCNIIEVTSLLPISIMQRIVYALLEKNSFVARDADHIVFTLLSEYSQGAATIVHMLTSLMQKSEDNSRTGFELAKQQLKLHIAHLKGLQNHENATKIIVIKNGTSGTDIFISSVISNISSSLPTKTDTEDISGSSSTYSSLSSNSKSDAEVVAASSSNSRADSDYDSTHGSKMNLTRLETSIEVLSKNIADDSTSKTWFQQNHLMTDTLPNSKYLEEETVMAEKYMKQTDTSADSEVEDFSDFPEDHKILENKLVSFPLQNSLHLFISDLLTCDEYISLPARHLLNCLCVIGPIPIPLFLIEEMDNIITKAAADKNRVQRSVTPLTQQLEAGLLRNHPHVFLYHKDFNPEFQVATSKLMYVPKLLCDVINTNMHSGDIALSITCVQQAIKNLLMQTIQLSINHLHFMLIVLNQLDGSCSKLHDEQNVKLKVQIAYSVGLRKEI